MRIKKLTITIEEFSLINGDKRKVLFLTLVDSTGKIAKGEVAPYPNLSFETVEEAAAQIKQIESLLLSITWTKETCFELLKELNLFPSIEFGLESVLLSLLDPIINSPIRSSALLMGSRDEIFSQADLRLKEGYRTAKLKVSQLSFKEAADLIDHLKQVFYLRIDVNRAWTTKESLQFFSQYKVDLFDYVEEPFQNPKDLAQFPLPLAVDESFPSVLSLKNLESLPSLKALIYKPSVQGGLTTAIPLYFWLKQRNVNFVLSSAFESELGLSQIETMANRLQLKIPIGTGTRHFL